MIGKILLQKAKVLASVLLILDPHYREIINIKCTLQNEKSEYFFSKISSQVGDLFPIQVEEETPKIAKEPKFFSDISLLQINKSKNNSKNQNGEFMNLQIYTAKQQKEINDGFKLISYLPQIDSSIFQDYQVSLKQPQSGNSKKCQPQ